MSDLAGDRLDATAGLPIFQEVLERLTGEHTHDETLALICRRVSELAGFDFCGIFLPAAGGDHLRLAASHAFPPRYLTRLHDVFLAPLNDLRLAGSPTETAIHERRTVVLGDTLTDASFRPWRALAEEGGYRALVSVPLLVRGEVLGVLNGYSERPRDLSGTQLATVQTLAAQAALALRLTMLVDVQQDTIGRLREANEQLRRHELMLERSHDIHLRLTAAVIAGADFQAVAGTLAELIGRPVLVTDAGGHPITTSQPPPDPGLASDPSALAGRIRIGAELLGHVRVEPGDPASRDLDVRAVEHAATVLALEIVKERVARTTEERLRADFLSDLLGGRDDLEERIVERARHYGMTLGTEHRVVVAALARPPAGRAERAEALGAVAAELGERLPGALVGRAGDTVTAAVPAPDGTAAPARLREAVAGARSRVGEAGLTAGVGPPARAPRDYPASLAGAQRCLDVLHRLGRDGETMAADELGILGLFVDSARPEELQALARDALGPVLDRDARQGSALLRTLESYIDQGCDARASAAELFVHVNTVKYRLRQVEELCGLDLRDPHDLVRVTIARLAVRLLGEP